MQRPPLLFLYPSLRHSSFHSHLLRPLRRHHITFPPPPPRHPLLHPPFLLRPQPQHHRLLSIRHTTTTTTTTPTAASPPHLSPLRRLRYLARSIPTLSFLTLFYILYSLNYSLISITGASMSPLLNPSSADRSTTLSEQLRRDWVWVEIWPNRVIRFADAELNPSGSSYSPSSDEEEEVIKASVVPWRSSADPTRGKSAVRNAGSRGLVKRGIVAVLYAPANPAGEEGEWLVKRIVALPGDVVTPRPGSRYPRDRVLVPDGCVWVEGDNEEEKSWDSNSFGPVGLGMLVGRVGGRVWPLRRRGRLEEGEEGMWPGRERVVEGGGRLFRR